MSTVRAAPEPLLWELRRTEQRLPARLPRWWSWAAVIATVTWSLWEEVRATVLPGAVSG